jgi:hypothetical protein
MSKTTGRGDGKPEEIKKLPKPRGRRRGDAVDKAILKFEKTLDGKNVTVGDYLRLVQLQKETDGDEPKDVECTWVEPNETKSSDK